MKKIITGIILSAILTVSIVPINAQPPDIDAKSYILIDSKTGQVLCEHNADEQTYPASTTKIMTAILGIENIQPEDILTVSQYAIDNIGPGGMNIGLLPGEQLAFKDILNALLVRSANETAFVVAESVEPDPVAFITKMNQRAKELGATNTNFVNPCGMDTDDIGKNHLTTARDLAMIAKHAMTLPLFRETVKQRLCTIPTTNMHDEAVVLASTNKLLGDSYKSDYYSSVIGIKTGFTNRAQLTLVASAVDENGMELISVILGCPTDSIYQYSKELLEYGYKNYSLYNLIAANSYITSVPVASASFNSNLDIIAGKNFSCVLPKDSINPDDITQTVKIDENIVAPIQKGAVLGSIEFKNGDTSLGTIDLVASRDVGKIVASALLGKDTPSNDGMPLFLKLLLVVVSLLTGFFLLRITLKKISRKRRINRF